MPEYSFTAELIEYIGKLLKKIDELKEEKKTILENRDEYYQKIPPEKYIGDLERR